MRAVAVALLPNAADLPAEEEHREVLLRGPPERLAALRFVDRFQAYALLPEIRVKHVMVSPSVIPTTRPASVCAAAPCTTTKARRL